MKPVEWKDNMLILLDQTLLPGQEIYIRLNGYREVIEAIKSLRVRGAPAIGIAAAYGIVLGALSIKTRQKDEFIGALNAIIAEVRDARPTAVNLAFAAEKMQAAAAREYTVEDIQSGLLKTAIELNADEEKAMATLSRLGAQLLGNKFTVLTHCNTGQLATGVEYGTALGVIKAAVEEGKSISVYADETRPVLQGARLTAWELVRAGIPTTLITDNMAGYFMSQRKIDCVIVGADRIAANGDTANKIGTYSLAVLANANHIPFYVAAPASSFDMTINSGTEIIIENRSSHEVTDIMGKKIAPVGVGVANPAFDITPAKFISAIITEKGIIKAPFKRKIAGLMKEDAWLQKQR